MKTSKTLQIQRWLTSGKSITPAIAFSRFHCLSLSQRIGELKRFWPIEDRMETRGSDRYKRYWIEEARSRRS